MEKDVDKDMDKDVDKDVDKMSIKTRTETWNLDKDVFKGLK
jgi:hypothetical protein